MIGKIKVVCPKEIIRIEKLACQEGFSEETFMETAGQGVANQVESFVKKENLQCAVTLLAGKGNNAGDGYVAGCYLLQKGFSVEAFSIYEEKELGSLCAKQLARFRSGGGKVHFWKQEEELPSQGLLLDGLVGTGFKGAAEGSLGAVIRHANKASLPILSIDVPSGLCAKTGVVKTVAIRATATIYLEFPKIGFFLEQGWEHTGLLWKETFGLPSSYAEKIKAEAFLLETVEAKKLLPPLHRTRNKYSAGNVAVVAGSPSMWGAGALSSYAALKAGAGIVKWFYLGSSTPQVNIPLEIISSSLKKSWQTFSEESLRMNSLLIGPGLGRDKEAYKTIRKALVSISCPALIDADALFFLSKYPTFSIPKGSILTPHRGELKRLIEAHKLEGSFMETCQAFTQKKKVILLVKGAPNFLFSPDSLPYILPFGNPGMATAGAGDVLSGIIASLLAQKTEGIEAAILGSFIHGLSGDIAAEQRTPYCLIASDIIKYLPKAFAKILL